MMLLKLGSRGSEVKELQSLLDKKGFSPGPIDGIFGPRTESAVKRYQQSEGLVVDGIVGPKTWGRLDPDGHNDVEEIEEDTLVDALLPKVGLGYISQQPDSDRFGRRSTIDALVSLGRDWHKLHNDAPRIRIGDISRKGGGPFPPHVSHRTGLDVDIGLMRSDGKESGTDIFQTNYSRPLTRELIQMISRTGSIKLIFFNDNQLVSEKLVNEEKGHDDHLHVRYNG